MIDLLLLGTAPQAALLAERYSWQLGERGERPVMIWGDFSEKNSSTASRSPSDSLFDKELEGDAGVDYHHLLMQKKMADESREEGAQEIAADDWLLVDPLLQQLIQGAELQQLVRTVQTEALPFAKRLQRGWSRFLLRNPDENRPFQQPPGTAIALVGGWERLLLRLNEKQHQLRENFSELLSLLPIKENELTVGWQVEVCLSSGERVTINSRAVVVVAGAVVHCELPSNREGFWNWSLPLGEGWDGRRLQELANGAEAIVQELLL